MGAAWEWKKGRWLPSVTSLPSDALSSVRLQQSPSVAAVLDQSNLDGLGLLVVFKTDQVGIYSLVLCIHVHVCILYKMYDIYMLPLLVMHR